jgi:hypothetical protein
VRRGGGNLRRRSAGWGEAAEISGGVQARGGEAAEISGDPAAGEGEVGEIVGAPGNAGCTVMEMFWPSGGSKNLTRTSRVGFFPGFPGVATSRRDREGGEGTADPVVARPPELAFQSLVVENPLWWKIRETSILRAPMPPSPWNRARQQAGEETGKSAPRDRATPIQ